MWIFHVKEFFFFISQLSFFSNSPERHKWNYSELKEIIPTCIHSLIMHLLTSGGLFRVGFEKFREFNEILFYFSMLKYLLKMGSIIVKRINFFFSNFLPLKKNVQVYFNPGEILQSRLEKSK